jgi:hypothetical protein
MTFVEPDTNAQPHSGSRRRFLGLAAIFTCTIFLSATLLFSVQPMFTKLILPLLGGASNVWNTAMVFFQAMLLGGYIYAHLISKYFRPKIQIGIHAAVTAVGLLFLPLSVSSNIVLPESGMPTFWLLGLFGATVGLPFFALSANAPLLQRWFSLTDHKDAQDPYFLYSASNAASLIILCAYPFLIEPNLRLGVQTSTWAIGYVALLAMIVLTAVALLRRLSSQESTAIETSGPNVSTAWKEKAFWVFLAFLPSSLMLGVTSYMTNNIASAPFLWIMPLALYLLTFVIVFARKPLVNAAGLGRLFPWVVILGFALLAPNQSFNIAGMALNTSPPPIAKIPLLLGVYFLISLYCHAILVERRPDVSGLTGFYILMSVGGVLGGVFNALIAPVIFNGIYEFAIVLALVLFLRPDGIVLPQAGERPWSLFIIGAIAAAMNALMLASVGVENKLIIFMTVAILALSALRFDLGRWVKTGMFVGLVIAAFGLNVFGSGSIYQDRSFYSLLAVKVDDSPHGKVHKFVHGDTFHNYQLRDPALQDVPTSYYIEGGSIHSAVMSARAVNDGPFDIAVVGLGAGAMACYEKPNENWMYFEIDPAVVDLARNTEYFSYVETCAPEADIRIGDARQKLKAVPESSLDMIVIDAFSSDSIPAHLVTREALELYQSRLRPEGFVFFHTSNKLLDVTSVVVRLADDAGLTARYIDIQDFPENPYGDMGARATGVLMGPEKAIQRATKNDPKYRTWVPSRHVRVWTDDYSSILGTLMAQSLKDGKAKAISHP